MSSKEKGEKRAIDLFEDAFKRLREGKPINLPTDTPVSQNNVAREAGRDPSALRTSRYPELIGRIQSYVRSQKTEEGAARSKGGGRKRKLEKRLKDCERQRDRLQSICHAQQELIDELHDTIHQLEQGKQPLRFPDRR